MSKGSYKHSDGGGGVRRESAIAGNPGAARERDCSPTVPPNDPCPTWNDHQFVEVYYGHECSRCKLFFAFGCAPWDLPVEEFV